MHVFRPYNIIFSIKIDVVRLISGVYCYILLFISIS